MGSLLSCLSTWHGPCQHSSRHLLIPLRSEKQAVCQTSAIARESSFAEPCPRISRLDRSTTPVDLARGRLIKLHTQDGAGCSHPAFQFRALASPKTWEARREENGHSTVAESLPVSSSVSLCPVARLVPRICLPSVLNLLVLPRVLFPVVAFCIETRLGWHPMRLWVIPLAGNGPVSRRPLRMNVEIAIRSPMCYG